MTGLNGIFCAGFCHCGTLRDGIFAPFLCVVLLGVTPPGNSIFNLCIFHLVYNTNTSFVCKKVARNNNRDMRTREMKSEPDACTCPGHSPSFYGRGEEHIRLCGIFPSNTYVIRDNPELWGICLCGNDFLYLRGTRLCGNVIYRFPRARERDITIWAEFV